MNIWSFVGVFFAAIRFARATTTLATVTEGVTAGATGAIDALITGGGPTHHREHLKRAERAIARTVDVQSVVKRLGSRLNHLSPSTLSLVRAATGVEGGESANFDQGSIDKARVILNDMMLDAWKRLDKEVVTCREYSEQNRAEKHLVDTDVSRIGGQIADAKGMMGAAVSSAQEAEVQLADAKRRGQAQMVMFNQQQWSDTLLLKSEKADLEVAEFIVKITKCKTGSLLQTGLSRSSSQLMSSHGGAKICKKGREIELHFQDKNLQEQAKALFKNPRARRLLSRALGGGAPSGHHRKHRRTESVSLLQTEEDGSEEEEEGDEEEVQSHEEVGISEEEAEGEVGQAPAAATTPAPQLKVPPPHAEAGPKGPPQNQWRKCESADVDCGLLHDSMSLLWGDMKDAVDELEAKMAKNEQEHKVFMSDLNLLMESLSNAKAKGSNTIAEATANMNGLQEELNQKEEEARDLESEYKHHQKECHKRITEILYTDICGVRSVRTSILDKSATTKPDKVVDCEFSDWEPGECSKSCDDNCPHSSNGMPCGGIQTLTRDVIQKNNDLGVPCPAMEYRATCNQVKCPVDCVISHWSGWSACTKECEGGVRQRTRAVIQEPKNGGTACDAVVETQSCNIGSCDRNCRLSKWSRFTGCTAACGGGSRQKTRRVLVPSRGEGLCPKSRSRWRLKMETCNDFPCQGDERCIAKTDLVIALDASGSLKTEGFTVVKNLVKGLISRYNATSFGEPAMKVGLVEFGNGEVLDDGTVKQAEIVSQLTTDMAKLTTEADKMKFMKGFTNMAQAFAAADKVLFLNGRKGAQSTVLVITDGKPSFKHQLYTKVQELKDKHTRIVTVAITDFEGNEGAQLMKSLSTAPADSSFVWIPGLKKLEKHMDKYLTKVLVHSCPRAFSPSGASVLADQEGYAKVMEGKTCSKGRVLLATNAGDASDCFSLVRRQKDAKFFSVGTRWNEGKCWMETTASAKCPEGFKSEYADFYQVVQPS